MEQEEFKYIVRIANTDLDGNKPIGHALTKIKGVSFMFANAVVLISQVDKKTKTGSLKNDMIKKIDEIIRGPLKFNIPFWLLNRRKDYSDGQNKHLFSGDIDFNRDNDIKRLKKIKSYRGYRHAYGLPVRGQRTRSNFRKNKGNVLGVMRKQAKRVGKESKNG